MPFCVFLLISYHQKLVEILDMMQPIILRPRPHILSKENICVQLQHCIVHSSTRSPCFSIGPYYALASQLATKRDTKLAAQLDPQIDAEMVLMA